MAENNRYEIGPITRAIKAEEQRDELLELIAEHQDWTDWTANVADKGLYASADRIREAT